MAEVQHMHFVYCMISHMLHVLQLDWSARKKNDAKLQNAYSEAVKAVGNAVSSLA